jgi:DUF4097 and DUF4098 domain-containing protein YvlB
MKNRALGLAYALMWMASVAGTTALAQEFQKSYDLRQDGAIRIRTISGDIKIQGYDGTKVIVEGFKQGRNCDGVDVVDRSAEDRIDVDVRFQHSSNCSVNFQVRVPRNTKYSFDTIRSVSGTLQISDISGRLAAESISGNIEIKNVSGVVSATATSGNVIVTNITGIVTAQSTSGNVDVLFSRIEGPGDMKFVAISGNVTVKAPASLDATVSMSTMSGGLKSDFPLQIQQQRYMPGSSARGRLGEGTHNIVIRSVSGRVSLLKM